MNAARRIALTKIVARMAVVESAVLVKTRSRATQTNSARAAIRTVQEKNVVTMAVVECAAAADRTKSAKMVCVKHV